MKALLLAGLLVSGAAQAGGPDLPSPGPQPVWSDVRQQAEAQFTRGMFDPKGAQIDWMGGWYWGAFRQSTLGPRSVGWIGCAAVNAKNRLGGYTGVRTSWALVEAGGRVRTGYIMDDQEKRCRAAVRPVAFDEKSSAPVDVADQLTKLAALHRDGVLTDAEFAAQKVKLLAR